MNTPAHVVLNLLILGGKKQSENNLTIVLGAILPDLPMFLFYFWEKFIRGTEEKLIWSVHYFDPNWQAFFDIFNSLPLIIIGGVVSYYRGAMGFVALFGSMALHALGDLPLHHDDGHHHFFPFSNWRFDSPVSYWDPRHYGNIVAPLEAIAVLVGCFILLRRHTSIPARVTIGIVVALYVIYWGYALVVWGYSSDQ